MRCANTYTDANGNTYSNSHPYANSDSDSTTTHTYADCNNDTNTYGDPDIDPYSHTTDYGLSAIPDGRSHQGSHHAVQFHGPGKPH